MRWRPLLGEWEGGCAEPPSATRANIMVLALFPYAVQYNTLQWEEQALEGIRVLVWFMRWPHLLRGL